MEQHSCPNCGIPIALTATEEDSRRRILELEAQVKILTERAFESADKITTYEHEVHTLKRQAAHSREHSRQVSHSRFPSATLPPTPAASTTGRPSTPSHSHRPSTPSQAPATPTSRITSFLAMRSRAPPSPPPDASTISLLEAEREARRIAEEKLSQVTGELEELTQSLFQSANEMVAEERKARAKVEERCKVLEERERKGRERLGRLEGAVDRVERVRGVLRESTVRYKDG